jgi:hypothetical protein
MKMELKMKINNLIEILKVKAKILKIKIMDISSNGYDKFKALPKKSKLIALVPVVIGAVFLLLLIFMGSGKTQVKVKATDVAQKPQIEVNEIKKEVPNEVEEASVPQITFKKEQTIREMKHLQEGVASLQSSIAANKDNLATKKDLTQVLQAIEELNTNLQTKMNEIQAVQTKQNQTIADGLVDISRQVKKVIADNPITVENDDFNVSSIVWVNGVQLINIHVNKTDSNKTLRVGESYGDWDLVSVDKTCAIFKNKTGVNKQCL